MTESMHDRGRDRPRRIVRMRLIVTAAAALLVTTGVVGLGLLNERQSRETLNAEIQARLLITARNLALTSSPALLGEFPELTLHPLVKEMRREQREISLMIVVDHRNRIQGHTDVELLGQSYEGIDELMVLPTRSELRPGERLLGNVEVMVAEAPVLHPNGEPIGSALVGQETRYVEELVAAHRAQQILLVVLVLGLTLVMLTLLMSRLLKPLGDLRSGLERIGRGDLDTPLQVPGRTELALLAEAVNEMAGELKSAQAEMVEKERLCHELELAREIQSSLLPETDLEVGGYQLRGAHRAAAEVGGDYYDFFELPDGKIALTIADVSGKGLAGCMIMSMLSVLLRSHAERHPSPRDLLLALDEQLGGNLKNGKFVTMFYGVLDPATGELSYASAAHSPLLVCRGDGRVEWFHTTGIPLGAVSNAALASTLVEERIVLERGDQLLQYTDGINEAFDAGGEQFGFERIERCVRDHRAQGGEALLQGIRSEVRTWIGDGLPSDDETLLVISDQRSAIGCEAVRRLNRAREKGIHLRLPAKLETLRDLKAWLAGCRGLDSLSESEFHLIHTALYEAVANIAEHALDLDEERSIDLWWISPRGELAGGQFILRDEGRIYRIEDRVPSDFEDPRIRRRGRGIGLDIIHGVTSQFEYHPDTAEGNITVLGFSDGSPVAPKEPVHV